MSLEYTKTTRAFPFREIRPIQLFSDGFDVKLFENIGRAQGTSGTDGGTTGGTNFTSAGSSFTTSDHRDKVLYISVSANGNVGFYKIVTVTNGTTLVLQSDAGLTSETDMTWAIYEMPNLEDDLNFLLSNIKKYDGRSNAYKSDVDKYLDPTNTSSGNAANKGLTWANIKGHTLDAKTVLYPIEKNSIVISVSDTEVTVADTTRYADFDNRTGLPMGDASEYDELKYTATFVELINPETGLPVRNSSDAPVWGRMIKGTELTNFKIKFYTGDPTGAGSAFTWTANEPASITAIYRRRYTMTDVPEDFLNKIRVLGLNEDAEVSEDIDNLQAYTGGEDGDKSLADDITNTTASYILESAGDRASLTTAVNKLNTEVDDRLYSDVANEILTDGDTISDSLEDLAIAIMNLSGQYVEMEDIAVTISKDVNHTLPNNLALKKDYATGSGNKYVCCEVNGQGVYMDSGDSANDRDFVIVSQGVQGTSSAVVKFHFTIPVGSRIKWTSLNPPIA